MRVNNQNANFYLDQIVKLYTEIFDPIVYHAREKPCLYLKDKTISQLPFYATKYSGGILGLESTTAQNILSFDLWVSLPKGNFLMINDLYLSDDKCMSFYYHNIEIRYSTRYYGKMIIQAYDEVSIKRKHILTELLNDQ